MRGAPHKGFACVIRRIRSRTSSAGDGAIGGSNTRRRLGDASVRRSQAERSGDRNTNPTRFGRAKSRAIGRRRAGADGAVRLQNCQLMSKGKILSLQSSASLENWSEQSKKRN